MSHQYNMKSYVRGSAIIILFIASLRISLSISVANLTRGMESRVVKSFDVSINEYPYATFVRNVDLRPNWCGGSLIMVQAVLSTAYCAGGRSSKRINIKTYHGAAVPKRASVVRTVDEVEVSPKYDASKGRHNLAVLFLDKRVPLCPYIKKIPLAVKNAENWHHMYTAGWGKQVEGKFPDFADSRHLRATRQIIISPAKCSKSAGFEASISTVCTEPVKSFHYKDEGNGLISNNNKFLYGVLSFVTNDGVSVYTSVTAHHRWITDTCVAMYKRHCGK